jgi:hypothetical protein
MSGDPLPTVLQPYHTRVPMRNQTRGVVPVHNALLREGYRDQ